MPLPERSAQFHFTPKEPNAGFNDHFIERQDIIDPLYPDAEIFSVEDSKDSDNYLRDKIARDIFNDRTEAIQKYVDEGWASMMMMRETGDVTKRITIYHKGDGYRWAEMHLAHQDQIDENGGFKREGIGLTFSEEIASLAKSLGLETGSIPDEIMLLALLQRKSAMEWINTREFIDRKGELDNQLKNGIRPTNSPIINSEIDRQIDHHWKRDEHGLPKATPEDIFPSELPPLESIASNIYITRGSEDEMSRNELVDEVILSPVGKKYRLETVTAPMPSSQASIEYTSTVARMNALAVIPRNGQLSNIEFRLAYAQEVLEDLRSRTVPTLDEEYNAKAQKMWQENVAVAVGINDKEVSSIKEFLKIGIRSFRLYTVATDGRMKDQLKNIFDIIDEFKGNNPDEDIELFIGQMTHADQLGQARNFEDNVENEDMDDEELDKRFYELFKEFDEETINKYIAGLYFGNGGGSMCSTASTGMGVNTLLLLHRFRNDPRFKNTSFTIEGGITIKEFPLVQVGAHAESIASQAVSVESPGGQLAYVGQKKTDWAYEIPDSAKPQFGEASSLSSRKEYRMEPYTGMPDQTEGQISIKLISKEMPSVAQILRERTKYLSQVFVKMGVRTMEQLHTIGTFQDAVSMHRIFGDKWMDQRDLFTVDPQDYEVFGNHLRKILHAPDDIPWQDVIKRAGINPDSNEKYYIIPSHLRRATAEQRLEGSPNGAGITRIK